MAYTTEVLDTALAVRRGRLRLTDVPLDARPKVKAALMDDRALITRARSLSAAPSRTRFQDAPVRSTRAS